jgi:hypothetical protein
MFFQVVADMLHVRGGGRRPADTHLGAEHLFTAGVHLSFLDELAPVSASFAFEHRGAETRLPRPATAMRQPSAVPQHGLSVAAGNLRQLRFLLLRKMHFHGLVLLLL